MVGGIIPEWWATSPGIGKYDGGELCRGNLDAWILVMLNSIEH
jgi:hypothetical protein